MLRISQLFCCLVIFTMRSIAQDLPITSWESATKYKPLVLYLSGDGGINRFSTDLCETIHNSGFEVYALNSRSYFYSRKTPEETARVLGDFLTEKLNGRPNQQIVLIGYSFGGDVLPFILNRLETPIHDKILVSFIIASSGSTDFEIHWADILGGNSKRSLDVISEINKMGAERLVLISSIDDRNLDMSRISLKYTRETLPGGHHFDGNTDEIAKVILNHIYK